MKIKGVIEKTNFLSSAEVSSIIDKVLFLEPVWNHYSCFHVLPYGPYPGIYKNIDLKFYNKLLDENFRETYTKIKNFVEKFLNQKIVVSETDSRPGFHIFGPGPLDYNYVNYHIDSFDKHGKIITFIIPLTCPNKLIGLNYILDKNLDLTKLKNSSNHKDIFFQEYKSGNLYIWEGKMIHSICPFILNKGEYRITLQFHVALHPMKKEGILFY